MTKIDSLNAVITAKEDRIEYLQNEPINQLTAGKSKPQLTLIHEDANTIDVYIIDTSWYAIRNVAVTIDDRSERPNRDNGHHDIKDPIKRQAAIDKDTWRYATMGKTGASFAGIVPRQLNFVKQIVIPKNAGIYLSVDVIWPDGFYTYKLKCDRVHGGYDIIENDCTDQIKGQKFPCWVDQNIK